MQPNGAVIYARVSEPLSLVQLPLDVNTLDEDARRGRLAARKPRVQEVDSDYSEIDDNFDPQRYASMWGGEDRRETADGKKESGSKQR